MTGLTTRQAYRRGMMAGLVARAIETVGALAQLWLLTQLLPKATFGRLVLALAIVQLTALLAGSGLQRLVIYRLSRADAPAGTMTGRRFAGAALGAGLLAGLGLGAACGLLAPRIAAMMGDASLGWWLRALSPLVPVTACLLVYGGWYQARQRMAPAIIVGSAAPVVLTVIGLAIVLVTGAPDAAIPLVLVAAPAVVLAGWWATRPVPPLRLLDLSRADLHFAATATGNGLVNNLMRQADVLMLGALGGPALVAEYAVAARLARLLRVVHDLLGPVFRPRIGHLLAQGMRPALVAEYDRIRLASLVFALAPAIVLLAAGPAILTWFDGYATAWPVLALLVAASTTSVLFGKSGVLLLMTGHAGWSFAASAVVLGLDVGLNLLLIPLWGAAGAAAATLLALLGTQTLTALLILRLERLATMSIDLFGLLLVLVASAATAAAALTEPWLAAGAYGAVGATLLVRHRATLAALLPARPSAPAPIGGAA